MTDEKEEVDTEPEFSLSGSTVGYAVEVRTTGGMPVKMGGQLIGTQWHRVSYRAAKPWEPSIHSAPFPQTIFVADLVSWNAANAHMWLLQCSADREELRFIETRIVSHDVRYSIKTKPANVVAREGGLIGSSSHTGEAELELYERNKMTDDEKSAK